MMVMMMVMMMMMMIVMMMMMIIVMMMIVMVMISMTEPGLRMTLSWIRSPRTRDSKFWARTRQQSKSSVM